MLYRAYSNLLKKEDSNLLDFIFFHQQPLQRFEDYLKTKKIPFEHDTEFQASVEEAGYTISISDDYDLEMIEEIEAFYDEMMDLNEQLVSEEEGGNEIKNAGITVNLSNGSTVLADVDPNLIYKLSNALSPDEIMQLVSAITDAVEKPDQRPLCKR